MVFIKNLPRLLKKRGIFFALTLICTLLVFVIAWQVTIILQKSQSKFEGEFAGVDTEKLESFSQDALSQLSEQNDADNYAQSLFSLTNGVRVQVGENQHSVLQPYIWDDCAADVAIRRAQDQAILYESDPLNQDDSDLPPMKHAILSDEAKNCGQETMGENLSRKNASPLEVIKVWIKSSGHFTNLVSDKFTRVGVGCIPFRAYFLCSEVFF